MTLCATATGAYSALRWDERVMGKEASRSRRAQVSEWLSSAVGSPEDCRFNSTCLVLVGLKCCFVCFV